MLGSYAQLSRATPRRVARSQDPAAGRRGLARAPRPGASKEMRDWAREHGYEVNDRGRVPADVVPKYEAAGPRRVVLCAGRFAMVNGPVANFGRSGARRRGNAESAGRPWTEGTGTVRRHDEGSIRRPRQRGGAPAALGGGGGAGGGGGL